jgi:hypothetical protein
MAGFVENNKPSNPGSIERIRQSLKNLSTFGMKYDDMVVRNSQAIGKTESSFFNSEGTGFTQDDAFKWILSHQDVKIRKYIAYFDKDYVGKRDFLRKFSLNGEIDFIIDTLTDDSINYDDKNFFSYPSLVNIDLKDNIIKEWDCMLDIQKELGFPTSNISKTCSGRQKIAYGYKWKYKS